MKTVRFLRDERLQREGGDILYYEGRSYELRDDQAKRWFKRGAAVEVPPKGELKIEVTTGRVETKAYADGTTATGPAPLPHASPTEQDKMLPPTDENKEPADGNTVVSAPAVDGQDGGNPGVGAVNVPRRGPGRPRRAPAGGGDQQ